MHVVVCVVPGRCFYNAASVLQQLSEVAMSVLSLIIVLFIFWLIGAVCTFLTIRYLMAKSYTWKQYKEFLRKKENRGILVIILVCTVLSFFGYFVMKLLLKISEA